MTLADHIAKLQKLDPTKEIFVGGKFKEPEVEEWGHYDLEPPFRYYVIFNMEQYPTDS